MRNRFWLGMTISVSTCFFSSATPASAVRNRRVPSNMKGLVTTPTVKIPNSRAIRAITEHAPVPVPPPMPAAMKTICEPEICARISSTASSAAASPISGFDPAPSPSVRLTPSCRRCSALDATSAWASVLATTNSTPVRPAAIMLLTALQPAPPTPITVILGLKSVSFGSCSVMLMGFLALPRAPPPAWISSATSLIRREGSC